MRKILFTGLILFSYVAYPRETEGIQQIQEDDNHNRMLQYFREPGYGGLNVFETPKETDVLFDGLKVRVGGDFALQFQALDHSNANGAPELIQLGNNVNLPTANLNLDVQLLNGMRMHLRTYLSSRHHNDAWVKGGYLQVDRLDFISQGFASGIMDVLSIRVGNDMINYGDAHFRRSDNAMTTYNPFIGNYIMDAFTTEPFLEASFILNNILLTGGISNGLLNPTVTVSSDNTPTIYGKLGWDNRVNETLRIRLTGSVYSARGTNNGNHLYSGDRAGARYYDILSYIDNEENVVSSGFRSGRINPGFTRETAFQINLFIKYTGLEFFGVFEQTMGNSGAENMEDGLYTQVGAELLYRFGSWDQFYIGGRYNSVSGYGEYLQTAGQPDNMTVNRINIGGGWFMTENTLVKAEYVYQNYDENFGGALNEANFSGAVIEAVISF